jgi:hypothetical protein
MRGGYLLATTSYMYILHGTVEVWSLHDSGTAKTIYEAHEYFAIPAWTPFILHFLQDTQSVEYWEGEFRCFYYHPYRVRFFFCCYVSFRFSCFVRFVCLFVCLFVCFTLFQLHVSLTYYYFNACLVLPHSFCTSYYNTIMQRVLELQNSVVAKANNHIGQLQRLLPEGQSHIQDFDSLTSSAWFWGVAGIVVGCLVGTLFTISAVAAGAGSGGSASRK